MKKALPECPSCSTCDTYGNPSTSPKFGELKVLAIVDAHACDHPYLTTQSGNPLITCECRCHTLWTSVQLEKIPGGLRGLRGDDEALS